eukprot:75811_1
MALLFQLIIIVSIINLISSATPVSVKQWFSGMKLRRGVHDTNKWFLDHYEPKFDGHQLPIFQVYPKGEKDDYDDIFVLVDPPDPDNVLEFIHADGAFFIERKRREYIIQVILDITHPRGPRFQISDKATRKGYRSALLFGDLDNYNIYMIRRKKYDKFSRIFWISQGLNGKCVWYSILELFQGPAVSINKMQAVRLEHMEEENANVLAKLIAKIFKMAYSPAVFVKVLQSLNTKAVEVKKPPAEPTSTLTEYIHDDETELATEFMGFIISTTTHAFCVRKIDGQWYNLDTGFATTRHAYSTFVGWEDMYSELRKHYDAGHTIFDIKRRVNRDMEDKYNTNKIQYHSMSSSVQIPSNDFYHEFGIGDATNNLTIINSVSLFISFIIFCVVCPLFGGLTCCVFGVVISLLGKYVLLKKNVVNI